MNIRIFSKNCLSQYWSFRNLFLLNVRVVMILFSCALKKKEKDIPKFIREHIEIIIIDLHTHTRTLSRSSFN